MQQKFTKSLQPWEEIVIFLGDNDLFERGSDAWGTTTIAAERMLDGMLAIRKAANAAKITKSHQPWE